MNNTQKKVYQVRQLNSVMEINSMEVFSRFHTSQLFMLLGAFVD